MLFSGMEKNKNVLQEILWNDLQDTLLGEKDKVQKEPSVELLCVEKEWRKTMDTHSFKNA